MPELAKGSPGQGDSGLIGVVGLVCRYPRAEPVALLDDKLRLTPYGRVLIPPRASPWNPALRVIGGRLLHSVAQHVAQYITVSLTYVEST